MKERIVNNYETEIKNICKGCAEGVKAKCKQTQKEHLQCALQMSVLEEFEVEQVPETFSELRELCKELSNKIKDIQVSCVYEKHIVIQWYNDDNTDIDVYDDGTIFVENHLVAENRTPQQMWQIIKSLVGEER